MDSPAPVHLICGFLGSGKTTLLMELLAQQPPGEKLAVLVNEFGRLGIDGRLLEDRGSPVKELAAGCICCSLRTDFVSGLRDLVERYRPRRVLVEATGLAEAGDLVPCVEQAARAGSLALASLTTVVDAEMFEHRDDLGSSYLSQIKAADLVLLNKIDLLPGAQVQGMLEALRSVAPRARIIPAVHCRLDRQILLETAHLEQRPPEHDSQDLASLLDKPGHWPGRPEADGFVSFAFEHPGVLDLARLERFLSELPWGVFRVKGPVKLAQGMRLLNYTYRRPQYYTWDQAGPTRLALVAWRVEPDLVIQGLRECLLACSN